MTTAHVNSNSKFDVAYDDGDKHTGLNEENIRSIDRLGNDGGGEHSRDQDETDFNCFFEGDMSKQTIVDGAGIIWVGSFAQRRMEGLILTTTTSKKSEITQRPTQG